MTVTKDGLAQALEMVGYTIEYRDDGNVSYEKKSDKEYCFGYIHDELLTFYGALCHMTIKMVDITSIRVHALGLELTLNDNFTSVSFK